MSDVKEQDGPVKFGEPLTAPIVKRTPLSDDRMQPAQYVVGESMHLCLEGSDTLTEGPQDCKYLASPFRKACIGQLIFVVNDAGTERRWMFIDELLKGSGGSLSWLVLRDLVPPQKRDAREHPVTPAADWRIKYSGSYRKWEILRPNGVVARSQIASQEEALLHLRQEQANPNPR